MHPLSRTEWFTRFRSYLDAFRFTETQVEFAASSMWNADPALTPEEACECYVEMMVRSGLLERRRTWRHSSCG